MIATAFDEENMVLDSPPGMSPEECSPLSAWRGPMEGAGTVVISCWKPTTAELEEIARTGRVWIIVMGQTMPPIAPTGHNPFTWGGPEPGKE